MRRRLTLMITVLLAAAVLALTAPAGRAQVQPNPYWDWPDGPAVGYCGMRRGSDVGFWQTILWSSQRLIGGSSIDKIFGPQSHNATLGWQGSHMLVRDGCVGVNTWYRAQHGYHYMPHLVYHLRQTGFGPYEQWYIWQEPFYNLPVGVRRANLLYLMVHPATGEQMVRHNYNLPG
jgi:hypothetical protein